MSITKNYQAAKGTYKVTFNFLKSSAPEAKSVVLLGDFNNWDINSAPQMKAGKEMFSTSLELKAGSYEFRYFIDQIKWENEPSADNFVSSPFVGIHNSVINLPAIEDKKAVKVTPVKEVKTTKIQAKTKEADKKPVAKKIATPAPSKVIAKPATSKVEAAKPATAKVATSKPVVKKAAAPKKVEKSSKSNSADDLKKIEGIGPKIAELLVGKGIATFDQLSKSKVDTLKSILTEAGSRFQMHDPTTWAKQATLAAKGNWAELKKLQVELIGGKKTSK